MAAAGAGGGFSENNKKNMWSKEHTNVLSTAFKLEDKFLAQAYKEATLNNGKLDQEKLKKLFKGPNNGGEAGSNLLEILRSDYLEYNEKYVAKLQGGKRKSLRKKRKSRHRKTRKY